MSCGLQDIASLEQSGIPAVLVHTDAFESSAPGQAAMRGQPNLRRVVVPHPIQDKDDGYVRELSGSSVEQILARLTAGAPSTGPAVGP